ncbi:hypothetical protein AMTRI_Chr03g55070 [Amborella trichopoda]
MSDEKKPGASTWVGGVFERGIYAVQTLRIESIPSNPVSPPKPLLITAPTASGEYPLFLFLHGYLLYNSFYSHLLCHLASHGFIVIAPQLYTVAGADCTAEINSVAAITNWFPTGLPNALTKNLTPDLSKLAISGHSRGAKTAFALALGISTTTTLKYSALLAIDPVDGPAPGQQSTPPVLTHEPNSLVTQMPVLVVGSGLGHLKKNPLFPPCAPNGVNHADFFRECQPPAWYFVPSDYGHLDMLDDQTDGIRGRATYCLCKNGATRQPMRRFVGGVMVAFARGYLQGHFGDLRALIEDPGTSPVKLEVAQFLSQ